jgi:hypothetical protein
LDSAIFFDDVSATAAPERQVAATATARATLIFIEVSSLDVSCFPLAARTGDSFICDN